MQVENDALVLIAIAIVFVGCVFEFCNVLFPWKRSFRNSFKIFLLGSCPKRWRKPQSVKGSMNFPILGSFESVMHKDKNFSLILLAIH